MSSDVVQLWQKRNRAFIKEVLPYISYMMRSGFPAFLSLIGIVSIIQYVNLINNVPENFPLELIGALVLTPLISYSPLRTWLKEADTIFLMPMEHRLHSYMKKSHMRSLRNGFIYLTIITLIYWPLYRQTDAYEPIIMVAVLIILKVMNHLMAWQERQFVWSTNRNIMRLFRWALMFILLFGWLLSSGWGMLCLTVIVIAMLATLYRVTRKQQFPWDRLITEEQVTMRRLYSFFSWFIDVRVGPPIVKQRKYLSWIIPFVPYRKQYTFVYLHLITFVRTEIGGICIRLLILGGLVNYLAATGNGIDGWGTVISYILFGIIITLQIGSLRKVHRYAIWKDIFPMQLKLQQQQIIMIDRLLSYILLFLLLMTTTPMWSGHGSQVIVMIMFAILYPVVRAFNLRRKLEKEVDDLD
ncbi:MAG TPA: ABC transporter permease [Candidatus Paenibacillus intestinavium]|nr:ABC transporter permease [Candidatus Paenibacillus intestinavium]